MSRPRIMTVYGTRPEAIKCAPIVRALNSAEEFDHLTVVTGQHREMLDQVNRLFGIVPDRDLDILSPGQALTSIAAKVLTGLDPVFDEDRPDAVVVQGDTTTVMAAAIAAFYRGIKVVHLEAGLRSGHLLSPFPEEANRRLASQVTSLHLAPTSQARQNLVREGIDPADIAVTGNTVIDALLSAVEHQTSLHDRALEELLNSDRPVLLVTTHRRENWGDSIASIGRAVRRLSEQNPELAVVVPLHPNPKVREAFTPEVVGAANVSVIDPLDYGEFTHLLSRARIVLTDSGGVQEEAPSLGKPVLVMRENTERPEAVTAGTVRLIGTDEDRIVFEVDRLLHDSEAYAAMANSVNPYGDGHATERVLAAIRELFGLGQRLPDFSSDR